MHSEFTRKLNPEALRKITDLIPEEWLQWEDGSLKPDDIKEVYFQFLSTRLTNSELFLKQAQDARKTLI